MVTSKIAEGKAGNVIIEIKEGSTVICLDLNQFSKIQDKLEKFLFGEDIPLSHRPQKDIVPQMYYGEMHDMLFGMEFDDGTSYSKNISITLVKECDSRIDTKNPVTYGELLSMIRYLVSTKKQPLQTKY